MIGQTVSHYEIITKLGCGSMGIVYKARDKKLKRLAALKFFPPSFSGDSHARERFMLEAQSASALDHPNICTIYEINETENGELFIAMAYYEGKTLRELINERSININESLDLISQIADGLAEAHRNKIIHRDIKPTNIFITENGIVKILDFGIAKVIDSQFTRTTAALGTPAYISPEQINRGKVDQRTDIWALGAVFYEMLSGQTPFAAEYEQAYIYSILNEEPKPLTDIRTDVPGQLWKIICKCLNKDPDLRYRTVKDLKDDLTRFNKGISVDDLSDERSGTNDQRTNLPAEQTRVKHLLIIEDDPAILFGLKAALEEENYNVFTESDGAKGYSLALHEKFDLILLDWTLPGKNGKEICKDLRSEGIETPIIMVTSKNEEIDKILGLEFGADDYVTKPFSIRELQARIRARLRRDKSRRNN